MRNNLLGRYWFTFDGEATELRYFAQGCGVTAYHYEDAINLLEQHAFKDQPFPKIKDVVEDFDVSMLDEKRILPNIGVSVRRGIWHPNIQN